MESNLSITLRNSIDALRCDVTENLKIIRSNEKIVHQIMKQGRHNEEMELIKVLHEKNRILLNQNKEAINIQLKMINFLNSYKVPVPQDKNESESDTDSTLMNVESEETPFFPSNLTQMNNREIGISEINADDYFILTTENKIVFNRNHPYYEDDEFYGKLLRFYKKEENYEMCARIVPK
ncbi:MAG: hypothetical protein PHU27_06145 [Salinivirgaceae bacterium]|nr:hypothetical protein [Salinivirgaceae bacterium]